jgi:hypothetical protein
MLTTFKRPNDVWKPLYVLFNHTCVNDDCACKNVHINGLSVDLLTKFNIIEYLYPVRGLQYTDLAIKFRMPLDYIIDYDAPNWLPNELWMKILSYVKMQDIQSIKKTCKHLYYLVKDNKILRKQLMRNERQYLLPCCFIVNSFNYRRLMNYYRLIYSMGNYFSSILYNYVNVHGGPDKIYDRKNYR